MSRKQISFTTLVFLFDSDCFLLTKTLFGFFTAVTWNYTCPCLDNLNLFEEETDNCKICEFAKLCCEKCCYATNHTFPTRERIKRKRLKKFKRSLQTFGNSCFHFSLLSMIPSFVLPNSVIFLDWNF